MPEVSAFLPATVLFFISVYPPYAVQNYRQPFSFTIRIRLVELKWLTIFWIGSVKIVETKVRCHVQRAGQ
jgi:hypothetical protein